MTIDIGLASGLFSSVFYRDAARKLRVVYEGATYHVTLRGVERRQIFGDDADREVERDDGVDRKDERRREPREEERGDLVVRPVARGVPPAEGRCAVREAVENHYISESRYASYLNILEDKEEGKYRSAY